MKITGTTGIAQQSELGAGTTGAEVPIPAS